MSADRLWIMIDIETTGPIIGRHSMTELGAVVGTRAGGVLDRFEALIAPLPGDPNISGDALADARERGASPADAMRRFADWVRPYRDRRATFIARPAAFDWSWIVWYAWTYLGENPFGFKAVCASSWLEAHGRDFRVDLPHRAVDDADIQLRHFFEHMSP